MKLLNWIKSRKCRQRSRVIVTMADAESSVQVKAAENQLGSESSEVRRRRYGER